jgi:hypothetical protein
MEDEEAFLIGFKLEKGNVGLSIVELKKLHHNAVHKQNKTLAKQKEKEQGNVLLGEIAPKPIIMENYEGIPIVPS